MICKHFLALFLWCHCYQIILNPFLQLVTLGIDSLAINVNSAHVLGQYVSGLTVSANNVTLIVGQEIILRCTSTSFGEANFTWHMERVYPRREQDKAAGEGRVDITSANPRYIVTSNSMTIKQCTVADVGNYYCRLQKPMREDLAADFIEGEEDRIQVRPKPYILDFGVPEATYRSVVIEEGHSLKIPCKVIDEFFPIQDLSIKWQMATYNDESDMNDVDPSVNEGISIEKHDNAHHDLIIRNVTMDHRRTYKCQVNNGVTENSKSILIRVKNKYTVIWPAVGIVLELVILIGVIIVVENRRVEPDKGAYDRKAIHQM